MLLYLVVAQVVIVWNFQISIHPFSLEQYLKENRTVSSPDDPWFWRIDTFSLKIVPLLMLVV